jgi:hypothetical protein
MSTFNRQEDSISTYAGSDIDSALCFDWDLVKLTSPQEVNGISPIC